jgi:hypothetical protein
MALRDRLVHLLTEAAEIEHNLLCSYLYAAFSLKRGPAHGLSDAESKVVGRWRETVMGVAIEEMAHLALANNVLLALGGAPHFTRPNLPVPPGYHPAGFVIRLAPLTKATLEHFIFLERPADAEVPEGAGIYRIRTPVEREMTPGDLTPSTPDYETIGEFCDEIRACLAKLAAAPGDVALVGHAKRQLSPEAAALPGLRIVRTVQDALAAVETIVEQGEGSSGSSSNCHFSRFRAIRREWLELEAVNPSFVPYLPAAHDPVMRKPVEGRKRVWITEPRAARLLDLGNALYALTLTVLQQIYADSFPQDARKVLVEVAIGLMHGCAEIGTGLASLPAQSDGPVSAGLSFAVPRNLHALPPESCTRIVWSRLTELHKVADALSMPTVTAAIRAAKDKMSTLDPLASGAAPNALGGGQ